MARRRRSRRRNARPSFQRVRFGRLFRNPLGEEIGLLGLNPRRRGGRRRRRNPLAVVANVRGLVTKDSLKTYGLVGVGFVAGGILPSLIERGLARLGVSPAASTPMRVGIGLAGAAVVGLATQAITKSREKAILVAAGAVAGVVGSLVLDKVVNLLPASVRPPISVLGLGSTEDEVRRAIEAQVRKELGEYVTPEQLGVGEYVTPEAVEEASSVAGVAPGMGLETSTDIEETDTFDGVDY
jgi:hypothetical protein